MRAYVAGPDKAPDLPLLCLIILFRLDQGERKLEWFVYACAVLSVPLVPRVHVLLLVLDGLYE